MSALAGRRALVTGAAAGLGRAFAEALANAGATVAGCDVDPAITTAGYDVGQVADVTDATAVHEFVDHAADRLGGIDIVVNNAGVVRQTHPTSDSFAQAIADFDDVIAVNLRGAYLVGRAAIPHLIAGGGDLVNITTDHVHTCGYPVAVDHAGAPECRWASTRRPALGGDRYDVYDASKWGLKGLTSCWARALAPHDVRVNALGMGATDSPMIRTHLERKGVPVPPNLLRPERVAGVLVALIVEAARTGDSVQLWPDHPCELPPVGLDGRLVANVAP